MDGLPDRATLRRRRYAAYRCTKCRIFHKTNPSKCDCGSLEFEPVSLKAEDYCTAFGHNGSEMIVPGTERVERPSEFEVADKRWHHAVRSHLYRSYCIRCGEQHTRRRMEPPSAMPKS